MFQILREPRSPAQRRAEAGVNAYNWVEALIFCSWGVRRCGRGSAPEKVQRPEGGNVSGWKSQSPRNSRHDCSLISAFRLSDSFSSFHRKFAYPLFTLSRTRFEDSSIDITREHPPHFGQHPRTLIQRYSAAAACADSAAGGSRAEFVVELGSGFYGVVPGFRSRTVAGAES